MMRRAFTLVEILIVVVILGILAALVTPQLVGATEESAIAATMTDLSKLRRAVGVYHARWQDYPPIFTGDASGITDGTGPWGPLVQAIQPDGRPGEYFTQVPVNSYVGGANARFVEAVSGTGPDAAFHTNYGWLYNPDNGEVYAACFDGNDRPIPRP